MRAFGETGRFTVPMEGDGGAADFRRPQGSQPLAVAASVEDSLSMAAWLDREGFDSRWLRWMVDYACRDDYGAVSDDVSAWAGVFAAPGTPPAVVEKLSGELQKFLARSDVQTQFRNIAFEPDWMGPDTFPAFLVSELDRWTKMSAEAGIEPQ